MAAAEMGLGRTRTSPTMPSRLPSSARTVHDSGHATTQGSSAGALLVYLVVAIAVLNAGQAPGNTGRSVWDGAFAAAQADRGRTFYPANCAECHGATLQGGEGKPPSGERSGSTGGNNRSRIS